MPIKRQQPGRKRSGKRNKHRTFTLSCLLPEFTISQTNRQPSCGVHCFSPWRPASWTHPRWEHQRKGVWNGGRENLHHRKLLQFLHSVNTARVFTFLCILKTFFKQYSLWNKIRYINGSIFYFQERTNNEMFLKFFHYSCRFTYLKLYIIIIIHVHTLK